VRRAHRILRRPSLYKYSSGHTLFEYYEFEACGSATRPIRPLLDDLACSSHILLIMMLRRAPRISSLSHVTQVSIGSKLSLFEKSLSLSTEHSLLFYIYSLTSSFSVWPTVNPISSAGLSTNKSDPNRSKSWQTKSNQIEDLSIQFKSNQIESNRDHRIYLDI
jgi:hypothetical protein